MILILRIRIKAKEKQVDCETIESARLSFLLDDVMMGAGSGMAVMFLCTGLLGSVFSLVSYRQKEIRKLG